jgi:hypothetical protein
LFVDVLDFSRPGGLREYEAWNRAVVVAILEYRAKFVRLPHGQTEISVTPANKTSVIKFPYEI